MPSLIIRDIPPAVYERLKKQAKDHRRSLSMEALTVLESRVDAFEAPPMDLARLPRLKTRPGFKVTPQWMDRAIENGRP